MSSPGSFWQTIPDRPHAIGLLIAGFTLLRLLLAATVPLLPQEAYYWSWSRHLDWSYFDHPPLATYSIALTTAALRLRRSFGIKARRGALVAGLEPPLGAADPRHVRRPPAGLLVAAGAEPDASRTRPSASAPTPDAPLIFAWTGAIWAVWRLTQSGDGRWWFAAGAFVGLSWLGKYSGVLLLPVVFALPADVRRGSATGC